MGEKGNKYKGYLAKLQALIKNIRSRLAGEIGSILLKKDIPQREAAAQLGVSQPDISKLKNGEAKGFSMDRLFQFMGALGLQVILTIRKAPNKEAPAIKIDKAF